MLHKCALFLLAISWSDAAFAQGGLTSTLHVHLRDSDSSVCGKVNKVEAIIKDLDREVLSKAKQDPTDRCHWVVDTRPYRFRTESTHFSLRLSGDGFRARTTCRIPEWKPTETDGYAEATFVLLTGVVKVTVTPIPSDVNLPYVRELLPITGPQDVACYEAGVLGVGSDRWAIHSVSLKDEKLRLPYFESPKDLCGVILQAARGMAKATTSARGKVTLAAEQLAEARARQAVESGCYVAPHLSGISLGITKKNLGHRKLTIGWE